jgi:hypothetical protein
MTILRSSVEDSDPLRPLRTETPPAIDGKLDDPVWQTLPLCGGLRILCTRTGIDRPGRFRSLGDGQVDRLEP